MVNDWAAEWPPARICAVAKTAEARYLPSEAVRVELTSGNHESLTARTIIEVGGSLLVEFDDQPNDWFMGSRMPDGVIRCWASYGDIESALRSL
jgi:hypothetical protein